MLPIMRCPYEHALRFFPLRQPLGLEGTLIDVAFIATASAFSSSGGTARSLLAITHQDGLVLHAAVVIVAPKTTASPCLADPARSPQRFPLRSPSENLQHPPGLPRRAARVEKVW